MSNILNTNGSKTELIGVAGQMRSGKNVIGEYLCKNLGMNPASFAKPVKAVFCDMFSVDLDFVEQWKTHSEPPVGYNKTIRQSLQFIGDGFRQIKPTVWVDYSLKYGLPNSVYMDCRYINELQAVKDRGGKNIVVWRPGFENDDPNGSEAQILPVVKFLSMFKESGRVSEIIGNSGLTMGQRQSHAIDLIDFFIINNGSLEDLYAKLDKRVIPFL